MFKRSSSILTISMLLIILILSTLMPSPIAYQAVHAIPQQTTVRCEPALISSELTSTVAFAIYVENVNELNAADIQMSFDTSLAQVVDADPNIPSTQIEILDEFLAPDFVVRKVADNSAGTIWYANTQVNPSPPVSGSGALARVTLAPQTAGEFTMHFTHSELVLNNGNEIPSTAQDCTVWFYDPDSLEKTHLPVIFAR
ncbi:MAG: cohesin domain-containing protein [Candidatus Promineifilaceae bacterium]|nr:cohesin domain-containing protein [Candidatus Promineifilaceae bacterium]